MTVSYVGAQGAAATTVTIPAHQVGDLILIFAYRDGSNTVPTAPTAGGTVPTWTQIGSSGGNTNSSCFHYAVATATNTTSGTWTNATELICLVYRGARIGASAGGSGAATTSIAYPALTLQRTNNTSWVVGVAGHRSATNVELAPTGMTNRASSGTEAAGHDTNGTVTSWSQQTVTVNASSAYRSWTVELRDKTVVLVGDTGAITVTRNDANLAKGRTLTADVGTFTVTRNDANIYHTAVLRADVRAFTVSSVGAGILHNVKLGSDQGKFFLPERNLLRWSQSLLNTTPWRYGATLSNFFVATLDGLPTPTGATNETVKFVSTSTTSEGLCLRQVGLTLSAVPYTVSVYAYVPTQAGISNWRFAFDFLDADPIDTGTYTQFDQWVRVSATKTPTVAGSKHLDFNLRINGGPPSSAGVTVYLWGAQLEQASAVSDYDPTGPAGATANDLRLTRRLVAEPRLFSINSAGAGVRVTHILTAETRSFTVTGNNADLHVVGGFDFNADLGTITITRNDTGVLVTRKLIAAARSFSVVGRAATISKPVKLIGATRAFNITGIAADIVYVGLNNEKQLYYQSVQVDPRKAIITPGVNEDQLVYYVKGFYRIL